MDINSELKISCLVFTTLLVGYLVTDTMDKKAVKADQKFEASLKLHIEKQKRRTLCFSVRGDQIVISGEENALDFTLLNMESMTVKEMMDVIKTMDDDVNMKYKTTETVVFPPLKEKFKGKKWSLLIARNELTTCLNILGFGKGGVKKYRVEADEPEGWPDQHSFMDFVHPSYAKFEIVNDIIESIYENHGYDIKSYHVIDDHDEEEEDEEEDEEGQEEGEEEGDEEGEEEVDEEGEDHDENANTSFETQPKKKKKLG